MTKLGKRHDRFIRNMMANPRVSKQFMQTYLPEAVLKRLDLKSLAIDNASFVNDELKAYISDIVIAGKFDGKPGYISLIVEHLSSNDKLMPLRMLEYIASAYRHHIKLNGAKGLWPVIFPIVVTNTDGKVTMKSSLADLTIAPDIMSHVMRKIHLVDLNDIEDQELGKRAWSAMLEIILSRRGKELLVDILSVYSNLFIQAAGEDSEQIMSCLKAMICYNEDITRKSDRTKLSKLLNNILGKDGSKKIMETLGDSWREEGVQQGIEQGLQKGIYLTAKNMLAKGMDNKVIAECTGLSIKEIQKLKSDRLN